MTSPLSKFGKEEEFFSPFMLMHIPQLAKLLGRKLLPMTQSAFSSKFLVQSCELDAMLVDKAGESWIFEYQYRASGNEHLGKIPMYLRVTKKAGFRVRHYVWFAESFTEDYVKLALKAAKDFGVKLTLIKVRPIRLKGKERLLFEVVHPASSAKHCTIPIPTPTASKRRFGSCRAPYQPYNEVQVHISANIPSDLAAAMEKDRDERGIKNKSEYYRVILTEATQRSQRTKRR